MFHRGPPEILPPGTLSKSQGTKFLGSKFFFYHKNNMLFNDIFGFVGQNQKFYAKNESFWAILTITMKNGKICMFSA